jgi:deazaflavin-dependent oxidoreductase (nitroreductase family)
MYTSSAAPARRSRLQRLIARLAHERWFAAVGRRLAPVDRVLYRLSDGRLTVLGIRGTAMPPTLLLTTTGRRSGRPRSTPVMYLRDGARIVITSENFGQARPAAWPLNLLADPITEIRLAGATRSCRARPATDEEAARYWPRFVELWPAHQTYRERSGVRRMFVLEAGDVRAAR